LIFFGNDRNEPRNSFGRYKSSTQTKPVNNITQAAAEDAATRKKKSKVGYARVSSEHQRGDLERQLTDLREQCPGYDEFVSDVGSGLNWKRPRFQALLGRVLDGDIEEVTI